MMRVYSIVTLDARENSYAEFCPKVWEEYLSMEEHLFSAFRREGINPVAVRVVSDFNGTIKKMLELVFCYQPTVITVPSSLYSLFPSYGVPDYAAPQQSPTVRLGYTGRCYHYKTKTKLITDGLQIGQRNEIVLDIFSLLNMTNDAVSCRLTHELLHVVGVREEDMERYKPNAFYELKNIIAPFGDTLQKELKKVYPSFCAAAAAVRDQHPEWVQRMVNLANRLYLEGFPAPPETVLMTSVSYPERAISKCNIDWRCHEVLYM
jgi:hypothetical protein